MTNLAHLAMTMTMILLILGVVGKIIYPEREMSPKKIAG